MDSEDLPYMAEYAKSNRSSCKSCVSLIAKDSLRIAIMVQSRHFDGKQPNWYHYSCFFGKCRPKSIDEVRNFHNLRWSDQEKVRTQIERSGSAKSGTKKAATKLITKSLQDFMVQYALSSRSTCQQCQQKIEKDEVRISHKEIDPEKPQAGLIDRWHHVGCFVKRRKELGWEDEQFSADMITGFKALDSGDRDAVKKLLDKKRKLNKKLKKVQSATDQSDSSLSESSNKQLTTHLKEQSNLLWKVVDNLKKLDLKKSELVLILEENDQAVPKGIENIYKQIADGMVFGRIAPCEVCEGGKLTVSSRGFYRCTGNISEWTTCNNTPTEVKRSPWIIPEELKEDCPYLKKYKYKARNRILPPRAVCKPLKDRSIILIGRLIKTKEEIKTEISKLGGSVTSSFAKAYCCISNKGEVDLGKKKIKEAELQDLFVVSEDFLEECGKLEGPSKPSLLGLLKKCSLASWGSERTISSGKRVMEEERGSGPSKKMKVVVRSGAAVDPESNLEDQTEVLNLHGKKYTATLSLVDMKSGTNSYYKLQLLADTTRKSWFVFRSWGRVGTNIGGTKLERYHSVDGALENFNELYLDKTGNRFGCENFIKHPRKFFPLDIDYGEEDQTKMISLSGADSKLHPSVQDLVKMIFDIESMKKVMMEFEIDLAKMPLGKLSRRQMQAAYTVLTEACQLIESGDFSAGKMVDCSNRFYTLIPHDHGMKQPPLLDNSDVIKEKVSMLESLMDIEVAYNLLKGTDGEGNALDASYEKLNCAIEAVDKDSEEFKMVERYSELTHASTHTMYSLKVEQLFKVNRKGETARFRPFKALPNRKLLWHGSRSTNYAGILSQGLRIAPPEAPVTGYMFGKGIYFADMVSKSANYCGTSPINNTGLCLLADVALGNMYELTDAKNVRRLPKSKHSVKGLGSTEPDPKSHVEVDGVTVPMGQGVPADLKKHDNQTSLLYNEYIVYDVAQVQLKYLVKFKFSYTSMW